MIFSLIYSFCFLVLIPNFSEKIDAYFQDEDKLMGVWIMVKSEKYGIIRDDESIDQKYTYAFKKNGDYILDFRIVRKQLQESDMSIMDYPKIKWSIIEDSLELRAFSSNGNYLGSTSYQFHFNGDTLVLENSILKESFLKRKEK
ncbi:hypothetical protein OU792_12905 [Algoriphagus sp. NF]|jgi:hypothetical protein|uniref:hypothetical protein n=1 Tax=Algoriphagus sp. NF TaxID=2992756 RepID=UPI00106680A0|nr:hypothetical protein [Algoriphagus sp. NF]MDE0560891.1 hypothetical protein [Algoriphagus sp. NF]